MRTLESLPQPVREIEHTRIPLGDGCRLAARVWLPERALAQPAPAVLEYIPYRKRDGTRRRDERMHRYLAGHGYACVRVDLRGSGESEGLLQDEYLPRELEDGLEVLTWIARQPWCSGRVGMIGKSWGGFNALQIAALAPSELAAIVSVCSSDDRYADDVHYMGGCVLDENLTWGSYLFTLNAQPPDPALVGERWRAMWMERLEACPFFAADWLAHQRRDAYWKHGSVCEDFARIRCPVYAIGGWADAYTNAVPRLLAGLCVPKKGLVGPWAHVYPHEGVPGPAIGFLQEVLRWFDHWLAGKDTGILREPVYRVWMQEHAFPSPTLPERPGRWVAEESWPSARILSRGFGLASGALVPGGARGVGERVDFLSPQETGLQAGSWCPFGIDGELPGDQRSDDGRSLSFDSEPLEQRVEILGAPRLRLALALDRPLGLVAARLCDVAPDGASERVCFGLLNLAHRDGHEHPAPLEPGARYELELELGHAAHAFDAGHRVRLALSTSYWPLVWPSPEPATLALFQGDCALVLPERPPRAEDARLRPFALAEGARADAPTQLSRGVGQRAIERDLVSGESVYTIALDVDPSGGPALARIDAIDLVVGHCAVETHRIRRGEPLSARAEVVHTTVTQRDGWRVGVETRTRMSATREAFVLEAELVAFEGAQRVFEKTLRRVIPRDHV